MANLGHLIIFFLLIENFAICRYNPNRNKQVNINNPHANRFNYDNLPSFVQEYSSEGLFYLGVKVGSSALGHTFLGYIGSVKGDCEINYNKNYKNNLKYLSVISKYKTLEPCKIIYAYQEGDHEYVVDFDNLPALKCNVADGYVIKVEPEYTGPGEEVLSCGEKLDFLFEWEEFNGTQNCTHLYLSEHYSPCRLMDVHHLGRKLKNSGCTIELVEGSDDHHKNVRIYTPVEGLVHLTSNKFVKNEMCNHECLIPVGDARDITVNCPDGFQYKLESSSDVREQCLFAKVAYIGWFALFLCKGSHHPYFFLLLIVWAIFGKTIMQITFLLAAFFVQKLDSLTKKIIPPLDPEIGSCDQCCGRILCEEDVKRHISCNGGKCAYCQKLLSLDRLKDHVSSCSVYTKYLISYEMGLSNKNSALGKLSQKIQTVFYYKVALKGTYWIVLVLIFLIVLLPPVYADQLSETRSRLILSQIEMDKQITPVNSIVDDPELDDSYLLEQLTKMVSNSLFGESSTIIQQISAESKLCGTKCWHKPGHCSCPSPEFSNYTQSMNKAVQRIKRELKIERVSRNRFHDNGFINDNHRIRHSKNDLDIVDHARIPNSDNYHEAIKYQAHLQEELARARRSVPPENLVSPESMTNLSVVKGTDINETELQLLEEETNFIHNSALRHLVMSTDKSRKYSENAQVFLSDLQSIQTNWGLIDIDHLLKPTNPASNIEVSWETYKMDKTNVFIKGTSTGKLNLDPHSGITWEIKNKDSDEKQIISIYIYEIGHTYRVAPIKYVRSRTLDTWFRGTCTGGCPNYCACKQASCHHKKWLNDRNWHCNPTWCLTWQGGCSCCAIDIKREVPKWVMLVGDVKFIETSYIICFKYNQDKINCQEMKENTQITIDKFKITASKAFGQIDYLPRELAYVWYNGGKPFGVSQITKFDNIILDPKICVSSCTHGEVGDCSTDEPVNAFGMNWIGESLDMVWTGVDIEHTCTTGSWPDCEYYNAVSNIDEKFEYINKTSTQLLSDFAILGVPGIEQGTNVLNKRAQFLVVRPKHNTGMIDFTIQATDIVLKRKEIKLEVENFKVKECKGCFSCTTGFTCSISINLVSPSQANIHFSSHNSFIILEKGSYRIESKAINSLKISGFSLLNSSQLMICVDEIPSICATHKLDLEPHVPIIIHKEKIIRQKNNKGEQGDGECSGWKFFQCTWQNFTSFFKNAYDWVKELFQHWKLIFFLILAVVLLGITLYIIFFCYGRCKSKSSIRIDAREFVTKSKSETKAGKANSNKQI